MQDSKTRKTPNDSGTPCMGKEDAKRFRYSVHGVLRLKHGTYTKHLRQVDDDEKAKLLGLIEETARKVLEELLAVTQVAPDAAEQADGGV